MRGLPVRITVRRKHVDEALTATDVNAVALRIEEEVIHIAAGRNERDEAAVRRRKYP